MSRPRTLALVGAAALLLVSAAPVAAHEEATTVESGPILRDASSVGVQALGPPRVHAPPCAACLVLEDLGPNQARL